MNTHGIEVRELHFTQDEMRQATTRSQAHGYDAGFRQGVYWGVAVAMAAFLVVITIASIYQV